MVFWLMARHYPSDTGIVNIQGIRIHGHAEGKGISDVIYLLHHGSEYTFAVIALGESSGSLIHSTHISRVPTVNQTTC